MRVGSNAEQCAPRPGEAFCFTKVSHQPLIVLTFDRPLSLSSASRDNFVLVSGSSGNIGFKPVRIDPVERAAVIALADPGLAADTEYRLTVKSSADPRNVFASFEGAKLEGQIVIRFKTDVSPGTLEKDPDPSPPNPCEAIKILASKCSGERCHGANNAPPAMGLSLVSYAAIKSTAIGQRSSLVQTAQKPPPGPGAPTGDFPYGMGIIDTSSAASFLIYKMMMDPRRVATSSGNSFVVEDAPGIAGTKITTSADPLAFVSSELRRRIPGSGMPAEFYAGGESTGFGPASLDELRTIRRWIDDGAKDCSAPSGDAGVDATPDAVTDSASDAPG